MQENVNQNTPILPNLIYPTWIRWVAIGSQADGRGSVRPRDLIINVENHGVSNISPKTMTDLVCHYVEDFVLEICLRALLYVNDAALQPSDLILSEVSRILVMADV